MKFESDAPRKRPIAHWYLFSICAALLILAGCETIALDPAGMPGHILQAVHASSGRNALLQEVEKTRTAQQQAKEQLQSTLHTFSLVLDASDDDLKTSYQRLNDEFAKSESTATLVHSRVDEVEDAAKVFFDKWESRLGGYADADEPIADRHRLDEARQRYAELIEATKRAAQKIDPVVAFFRDQILFIKYNLNPQAIVHLKDDLAVVKTNIATVVGELDAAIAEADAFIRTMSERRFAMNQRITASAPFLRLFPARLPIVLP